MPRVSVLVPAYNHEHFVKHSIQSVLDQHFEDFELVIVDDGSSDGTLSKIQEFSDPRIKIFSHEKNLGAVVAERTCFENSTGEYVAILNSDDMFCPDKLEKQVKFLDENRHYGAVFSYAEIIDENGNRFTNKDHFYFKIFEQANRDRYEWLNYFFNFGNCLCHPSVLIRRQCYETTGFYNNCFAQLPDFDFWIRLCLRYEIFILPEKLVRFRVLPENKNASGGSRDAQFRNEVEFFQILTNFLLIPSYRDFIKIFPRPDITLNHDDDNLIPFYLAKLCLEKKNPIYQIFALNVLYSVFHDKERARTIEDLFGFSYRDVIHSAGSLEIFSGRR